MDKKLVNKLTNNVVFFGKKQPLSYLMDHFGGYKDCMQIIDKMFIV